MAFEMERGTFVFNQRSTVANKSYYCITISILTEVTDNVAPHVLKTLESNHALPLKPNTQNSALT